MSAWISVLGLLSLKMLLQVFDILWCDSMGRFCTWFVQQCWIFDYSSNSIDPGNTTPRNCSDLVVTYIFLKKTHNKAIKEFLVFVTSYVQLPK